MLTNAKSQPLSAFFIFAEGKPTSALLYGCDPSSCCGMDLNHTWLRHIMSMLRSVISPSLTVYPSTHSCTQQLIVFIYRHYLACITLLRIPCEFKGIPIFILHFIKPSRSKPTFSAYPLPTDYRNHGVVLSPRTKFFTNSSHCEDNAIRFRRNGVSFNFLVHTRNNLRTHCMSARAVQFYTAKT